MKITGVAAITGVIAGLTLGGCAGSPASPVPGALSAPAQRHDETSTQYSVLTKFTDYSSGSRPNGGLIDVNGTLYGVTRGGGLKGCGRSFCGTVYSLTTGGVKHVLYKFKGVSDGYKPVGRLLNVDGTLYGTTAAGGSGCGDRGCGTVFSVTTTGSENLLYRFAGGSDGAQPNGGLIAVNGILYGTTVYGGSDATVCNRQSIHGCGTVFSISTSGNERVLHRFASRQDGGAYPVSGLIGAGGTLYGTTFADFSDPSAGTVYSITANGSEKTLYRFKGAPDASNPWSQLTNVRGTLYGTSAIGGAHRSGAVFSINAKGAEKVVYSFPGSGNFGFSARPGDPITYLGGRMYVAQARLWSPGCDGGCGSLYSITPSGVATVLHEFDGGSDGCVPSSGLLAENGTLYGATALGGQGNAGCRSSSQPGGTVYSWTP